MKLVANIQLKPDIDQAAALRDTIERCNAACDWMSGRAFETKTFKQFALHMLCYHEVRDRFGLAAQVAVRCIAKVADAYKAGVNVRRRFRPHAAQPYDERIVRFRDDEHISIWTLGGRSTLVFVCGTRQRALLKHRKGDVGECSVLPSVFAVNKPAFSGEQAPLSGALILNISLHPE